MIRKIFILFTFFISLIVFSQEPTPPVFENITISSSIRVDCPQDPALCHYTYIYIEANPATNTATLTTIYIPVNDIMEDVILPQPIDLNREVVATSYHETYYVDYERPHFPSTPLMPEGHRLVIDFISEPGMTGNKYPIEIPSYKPPTIKTLWVKPDVNDINEYIWQLSDYRGIDPMVFPMEEALQIDLSYIRKIPALGPTPADLGTFEHWDILISDVAKSKELGWVSDNNLYTSIYQKLTLGRESAYNGDLNDVNQKLDEVINLISSSNQNQRREEFYCLVYYNALSLKERIPWPCEPKLTATPDYAKHIVGEMHSIECKLINQSNGEPLRDQELTLEVLDGPNVGTIVKKKTDQDGIAILSYIGYDEGLDKIEIYTPQGTFAEKAKSNNISQSKGNRNPKGKTKKKERKRIESDCAAFDKVVSGLYAEWEGYIDLAVMISPKALKVTPGQRVKLYALVMNGGEVSSPPTTLRLKMADKPFNSDPPPVARVIGELDVDSLPPRVNSSRKELEYVIGDDMPSGLYYFDACVDPDNKIVEKNEWNNCGSSIVSTLLSIPKIENNPPDCSKAVASKESLWPPNHKLETISIEGITDKENDPFTVTVTSITQDEPTNGVGDGDTSPDGFGVGTSTAQVRSERSGNGNGRVYQINFKAVDSKGGECNGFVKVGVPHDKKDTAIDDGQNYDSTKP